MKPSQTKTARYVEGNAIGITNKITPSPMDVLKIFGEMLLSPIFILSKMCKTLKSSAVSNMAGQMVAKDQV